MLKSLTIQNYVLIDHMELDFSKGFSVITGETGAGKSILLGALGLILGDRADMSAIGDKDKKCFVEGVFEVDTKKLNNFFTQYDIPPESEIIIRRILLPGGKSRAFINEIPVKLEVLKSLSGYLVDIHSQHQNQILKDSQFQLGVVDIFADNETLRSAYQAGFEVYKKTKKEYKALIEKSELEKNNLDFYQHQLQKFEVLDLENLAVEALDSELEIMQNSEQIQQNLSAINQWLNGGDQSVIVQLNLILSHLQTLQKFLPQSEKLGERMESVLIEVDDLSGEFENLSQQVTVDPSRLAQLQSQMSTLYQLFETFRVQKVSELLQKQSELADKVSAIERFDERIDEMKRKLDQQESDLKKQAEQLTKSRKKVFECLEVNICDILKSMGMPHAQLKIEHKYYSELKSCGYDQIFFLFSANLGQNLQDISRSASGGEISRIMFALKSLLSSLNGLPTIIFDEIDTGISGNIAETMGILMKKMGLSRQVLTITHLPQIAAKGDHHLQVIKDHLLGRTTTSIVVLSRQERIHEIASMLSGKEVGVTALGQAEQLMTDS